MKNCSSVTFLEYVIGDDKAEIQICVKKVTAESQAFHSTFKRHQFFLQLLPLSLCLESRQRGARGWSEAMLDPGSMLFHFETIGTGNSAITLSLCARALGNVHVLSTKHLFPCSPGGSLGGRVVWFISLNCRLMNGTRPSTATHSVGRQKPLWVCVSGVLPFSLGGNQKEIDTHWSFTVILLCVSQEEGWMWSHYFWP